MRIANLRHYVALERPVYSQGDGGKTVMTWAHVKHLYIGMEGVGSEQVVGEQMQPRILWSIQAWKDDEIKPNCRFKMGTRIFDIIAIVPPQTDVQMFVDITAGETPAT